MAHGYLHRNTANGEESQVFEIDSAEYEAAIKDGWSRERKPLNEVVEEEPISLSNLTKAKLIELAEETGIEYDTKMSKAQIIDLLLAQGE